MSADAGRSRCEGMCEGWDSELTTRSGQCGAEAEEIARGGAFHSYAEQVIRVECFGKVDAAIIRKRDPVAGLLQSLPRRCCYSGRGDHREGQGSHGNPKPLLQ